MAREGIEDLTPAEKRVLSKGAAGHIPIDLYPLTDAIERAAGMGQWLALFHRADPSDAYLRILVQIPGVLPVKSVPETKCQVNGATGEIECVGAKPGLDCRLRGCRCYALVELRREKRLRQAYALRRRKLVGL